MNDAPMIEVSGLYKIFGSNPDAAMPLIEEGRGKDEIFDKTGQTVGVHDAELSIREGEIFVVMGLSGSGKSTMVRLLNRLIEPTSGSIRINGRDVTSMSHKELIELRRRDLAMVFQSFALMPHRTVLDNAAFGLEVAGEDRDKRRERALEALEQVGLEANANSYPDELSGGMQQRVGLARALATDPSIMLMDEAFSALDPLIRTEMQDELLELQRRQARTVVFISHDLDEAMRIGDRIAIMQDGRIVQVGTPEEIVTQPANDYVRSFFYGVDISQVFTAADIMDKQHLTVVERPGMGVRAALESLRRHDRDFAVVVGSDGHYEGIVSADALARVLNEADEPGFRDAFESVEPVPTDGLLDELIGRCADTAAPIPVVDADGRYRGAVSRSRLLRTLDRTSDSCSEATESAGGSHE
ncbi:MAG: glycine betaine/L-proline ABC transporter ATP-binding protein ProV [Wenzhouxiangella sp.]|jgi:glycine betaine/proline transport system ATP-binding protein|nr:glycine betaine/L-proline ABC transporter ATP-binding protein ProV [Wenzhouxiangella sp.]